MIHDLITKAEAEYGDKLPTMLKNLESKIDQLLRHAPQVHSTLPTGSNGLVANSISLEDARLLYLLVLTLKPKVIFEIGTWIGTSSMVMAEAMRASGSLGKIYTCDADNYYVVSDSYRDIITPIFAYSDTAITHLPPDTKIDFVFADGELTFSTIKSLKPKLAEGAIIATHDFELPAEKGVLNVVRMQLTSFCTYTYILPEENIHSQYNSGALAILVPNQNTSAALRWSKTLRLATIAFVVKVYRKFLARENYQPDL